MNFIIIKLICYTSQLFLLVYHNIIVFGTWENLVKSEVELGDKSILLIH